MKKTLLAISLLVSLTALAQNNPTKKAQPIVEEGKLLYQSEMAAWYGTDLFLENYENRENIGGYFAYTVGDTSRCIFFSKSENPIVIGTISFDSTYNTHTAKANLSEREFTSSEFDLYIMRKLALAEINSDTLFKSYKNTRLNLIPLIHGNEKKVYVLTGPEQSGVVIFGNDYLLTFDKNNKLILKKRLHKNIIPIYYGDEDEKDVKIEGAMHSHLPETGDFITATDICTLMLYAKFAEWKTHNVVSKKYLNVLNCETNQLTVIPMETIKKINESKEKRNKKKKKEE